MLKGIDIDQRIEFSSKLDKDDTKTIFIFKPLSALEMMNLSSASDDGQLKLTGTKIFDYLEMCIVEIKNYRLTNVRDALVTLSAPVLTELITEATRINNVSEQDSKN